MDGVTVSDQLRRAVPAARSGEETGLRDPGWLNPSAINSLETPSRPSRLPGVDVARGIAVLGMYAVHVGPNPANGGLNILFYPFVGHSAALFAVLAGVSIALMSGGRRPKLGADRIRVSIRLGIRAILLVLLGLWLTSLNTHYLIILAYYGMCFLVVLPFLRLRAKALMVIAIISAMVVPWVSYLVRVQIASRDLLVPLPDIRFETFGSWNGVGHALVVLSLTGTFPAVTLVIYIFAGMALGRMNLGSVAVCRKIFWCGTALAVAALVASWLATEVFGGMESVYTSLIPSATNAGMSPEQFFELWKGFIHGTTPTMGIAWQLLSTGASCTTFDLLISLGLAAVVISGCQLLTHYVQRGWGPFADLGERVLSAYVLHFFAIWLLWTPNESPFSLLHFIEFSLVALVAAVAWKRWVGRGPFEWALRVFTQWPAKLVVERKIPKQRS